MYIHFLALFLLPPKECEGEIAAKSDIIVRLEIKTEEISRMLIRLNSLPH